MKADPPAYQNKSIKPQPRARQPRDFNSEQTDAIGTSVYGVTAKAKKRTPLAQHKSEIEYKNNDLAPEPRGNETHRIDGQEKKNKDLDTF